MSFVTNLVLTRLVTHLTSEMQTKIALSDKTRADTVKLGRFQENPMAGKNVYLSVSGGSQTDPELVDGIVTVKDFDRIGFNVPPREIGGGQMWWRRGEVKIGCFLGPDKLTEVQAAEVAYEAFGRLQAHIEDCRIADLVDSYGEHPIKLFCFASNFMESGGQNNYIWRGSV